MTIPSGAAAVNPGIKFPVSRNISQLAGRTRNAVVSQLRNEKYPNSIPENWTGKKVKATQLEGIDATKVTTGVFTDEQVPGIGQLRDAIYQAFAGGTTTGVTAAQVKLAITTRLAAIEARLTALESA